MFADQRHRLMREDDWTVPGLAEELYAMFSDDDDPVDVGSGIKIGNPLPNVAPIQLGVVPDVGMPIFSGKKANGESFTISITPSGVQPQPGPAGASGASSTTAFMGTVVSGTGNTYVCALQTATGTENRTVIQQSIDPAETIPAGTPVYVIKVGPRTR